MTSVMLGSKRVRLADRDLIGEGGEGLVYRLGDRAVKIYTSPDNARADKLRAFPTSLPSNVVAPLELCRDTTGQIVGFAMRALDGAVDLSRLGQRRFRETQVASTEVLRIFRALGATVAELHAKGVVVGDLNDGNVMITPPRAPASGWTPWLIDADSMQFGAYPCVVAHERFLDPRLYNVDLQKEPALSRESDWYALAVLLFGSLLYIHPFGGAHPSHPTMLRRAEARVSVLRADVKRPAAATRPDVLSDDVLAWFERVFERDAREPLPTFVLETRFTRCSCGAEHARTSCPTCSTRVHVAPIVRARGQIRATRVFRTERGRILAAVVQNGLKHVHEEDCALLREDGTVVLRRGASDDRVLPFFEDPNRVVRLAGSATWIGARGRFSRLIADNVIDSIPVGLVRGELAADASVNGLVSVQGDALVRAESGTLIGQILEGQTHVRAGTHVGFAFYRAGEVTVAFVFDPQRGPLRQVDALPHIAGKLLGWSAVFDDAHVLVTFATENAGRVVHAAHLMSARAEVIASESDAASPIARSLAGRALAGGNVLVATDDGLVLMKADPATRSFTPARLFPEGRDFAAPDDELLVGPSGSLFVVTHDEITHLCFTD